MFNNILVPTDGSDHANKAVRVASDLAAKYDARVVFLHVLLSSAEVSDLVNLIDVMKLPDDLRDELEQIEKLGKSALIGGRSLAMVLPVRSEVLVAVGDTLLDEAERVAKDDGVTKIGRKWKQGAPATCILSSADEEKADLIVMGTRGLGDFKGLLVGSVSHKVSHLAPCTCITVK
jgi:nucleotide-binding universal stress UspA family protein